jgi:(1->4)-alpha-D-glucan 1-alpha-D-glucosylmutase
VAFFGYFNSLAQLLLKLTSPGVPDLYQGGELWDFSLVDPDNCRPVDFDRGRDVLAQLQERITQGSEGLAPLVNELGGNIEDGRIKAYLIYQTLSFRRARPDVFAEGSYLPLEAVGARRDHVCAFARTAGDESILVIVPRLVVRLTDGAERPPLGSEVWGKTRLLLPPHLAGRSYRNLFTGEELTSDDYQDTPDPLLATILGLFPVALLQSRAARLP